MNVKKGNRAASRPEGLNHQSRQTKDSDEPLVDGICTNARVTHICWSLNLGTGKTRVGIYSGGLLPLLLQRVNDDRRDGKFYRTSHATLVVVPTDQPNRGQTSFANINTAAKAHTFRDFPTTGSLSRICSHYSRENMENIKVDPRLWWSPFPQVHRTEGCFGAAGD